MSALEKIQLLVDLDDFVTQTQLTWQQRIIIEHA